MDTDKFPYCLDDVILTWMLRDYFKIFSIPDITYICDNIITYVQPPDASTPYKPYCFHIICEVKEVRICRHIITPKELFSRKYPYEWGNNHEPQTTDKLYIHVCSEELYKLITDKQLSSIVLINYDYSGWYVSEHGLRFTYSPHQRYLIPDKLCIRDYHKLIKGW